MEPYLDKRRTKMTEIVRLKQVKMDSEYSSFQARGSIETVPFIQDLIGDDSQEALVALFLDIKNKVTSFSVVFRGLTSSSNFNSKQIMQRALISNASRIIIAHNHPSGEPYPSEQDRNATRQVAQAGTLLGVKLLDSLIVTKDDYYSFQEEHEMFNN